MNVAAEQKPGISCFVTTESLIFSRLRHKTVVMSQWWVQRKSLGGVGSSCWAFSHIWGRGYSEIRSLADGWCIARVELFPLPNFLSGTRLILTGCVLSRHGYAKRGVSW